MSITSLLAVGTGGALGAIGRWGLSLLPFRGEFPLLTLVTNLLGAVLIGFIAGWAGRGRLSPGWTLFWKTGVCGGFTTFSTFSLESLTLLEKGRWLLGGSYMVLSVVLCLLGVALGQRLSRIETIRSLSKRPHGAAPTGVTNHPADWKGRAGRGPAPTKRTKPVR